LAGASASAALIRVLTSALTSVRLAPTGVGASAIWVLVVGRLIWLVRAVLGGLLRASRAAASAAGSASSASGSIASAGLLPPLGRGGLVFWGLGGQEVRFSEGRLDTTVDKLTECDFGKFGVVVEPLKQVVDLVVIFGLLCGLGDGLLVVTDNGSAVSVKSNKDFNLVLTKECGSADNGDDLLGGRVRVVKGLEALEENELGIGKEGLIGIELSNKGLMLIFVGITA
jgi:hypothetical protein